MENSRRSSASTCATSLGVDITKSPKYLLVSGTANFRRGAGGVQMGSSVLYVAELDLGQGRGLWRPLESLGRNAPAQVTLTPLDVYQFRNVQRAQQSSGREDCHSIQRPAADVPTGTTVAALLAQLELRPAYVAVEINLELVPRGQHGDCVLREGDRSKS